MPTEVDMAKLAHRLKVAVQAVVPQVVDVSIGDATNTATYKVFPAEYQAAAQATIDAFNPNDPAHEAADVADAAQLTSRQKDILTTCALIVRARGITAWNNMTTPQKVAAAFAEADVWRDIRIWAENNL